MNETNNLMGSALGALVESKAEVARLRERVEEQGAELTKLRLKLWRLEDELHAKDTDRHNYRVALEVIAEGLVPDAAERARRALDGTVTKPRPSET